MKIELTGNIVAINDSINRTTGEVRIMLSIIDTDVDDPQLYKLKAPKDTSLANFKKNGNYTFTLDTWSMNGKNGFFIKTFSENTSNKLSKVS